MATELTVCNLILSLPAPPGRAQRASERAAHCHWAQSKGRWKVGKDAGALERQQKYHLIGKRKDTYVHLGSL